MSKEYPILFSAPMVQAILDGRKSETRRTRGLKRINARPDDWAKHVFDASTKEWVFTAEHGQAEQVRLKCPYGQAGDELWVRESWRADTFACDDSVKPSLLPQCRPWYEADGQAPEHYGKLRPSIFMPRWASRIQLVRTDTRLERLNDISEDGAISEGVQPRDFICCNSNKPARYSAKTVFSTLWTDINGVGSWNENPWVWVIKYMVWRVKP